MPTRLVRAGLTALSALAMACWAACGGYVYELPASIPEDAGVDAALDAGVPDAAEPPDASFVPDTGGIEYLEPDASWHDFEPCAEQTQTVELVPLDLMIVQDISYSMDFESKWASVKSALKAFIQDPEFEGMGVGLQFFPLRAQCRVSAYQVPAVDIRPLPEGASDLIAALEAQRMVGGTPMVPVLEGVHAFLKARLEELRKRNEWRKVALVLATDGVPDETCVWSPDPNARTNSLENALEVVREAARHAPTVSTFVIGVGRDLEALQALAEAGGTKKAFLMDVGVGTEKAFFDALREIRKDAQACEVVVPPREEVALDLRYVAVIFTPDSGGLRERFTRVDSLEQCEEAPLRGWYYDDPENPSKVVLCPQACARLISDNPGNLSVAYACEAN